MTRLASLLLGGLAAAGTAFGQASDVPPALGSSPRVEFKGTIRSVKLPRGQGMPVLAVKTGDATLTVFLGSMRYLLENNFNPKAGEEVTVAGFKVNEQEVYAISLTLAADGRTLKLRDELGRPLWQRGRYGQSPPRRQ